MKNILIEISGRHAHLSRKEIDVLFGKNYQLKKFKQLSQPSQFAAEEKITLINGDRKIEDIRIVGPERSEAQVELSKTDVVYLKIDAPLRKSGNLENTPGIELKGPRGSLKLEKGVIVAHRHLHISEKEAEELGLRDGQYVSIKVSGERDLVFNKVVVRVNSEYKLAAQVDTDEGNAAFIDKTTRGELII